MKHNTPIAQYIAILLSKNKEDSQNSLPSSLFHICLTAALVIKIIDYYPVMSPPRWRISNYCARLLTLKRQVWCRPRRSRFNASKILWNRWLTMYVRAKQTQVAQLSDAPRYELPHNDSMVVTRKTSEIIIFIHYCHIVKYSFIHATASYYFLVTNRFPQNSL